jgi:phosphopantothenoylcysteine synthetase/decarboxylase
MAAAVSDFTPRGGQQSDKIRRGEARALDLVPTEDIVAEAAKSAREDQRIIAFALEAPDKLEHNALEKLQRKQVDAIVANPLETMDASCITAHIYAKHGKAFTPPASMKKSEFAKWLILNLDSFLLLHG